MTSSSFFMSGHLVERAFCVACCHADCRDLSAHSDDGENRSFASLQSLSCSDGPPVSDAGRYARAGFPDGLS